MTNVLAMVLAGGRVDELLCLTERRAKSALPIFGIYRIIDFVLSNLMHAGIENVGILSQYRPHGLVRHIGTGEHWDFVGRTRGIRILPPYHGAKGSDWYRGTADAVYQNIPYIDEFNVDHIFIASADHVYRMDYKPLLQFHNENNADATICFTRLGKKSSRFGYGVIDKKGRLRDYLEKPAAAPSDFVSMTVYIFKKDFLIDMLKTNARESSHEFGRDIIPRIIKSKKVYAYIFDGYWAYARTVDSYYRTNMDLLAGKINLHGWHIRTNLIERSVRRDRVPAHINGDVVNSVISDECYIEGTVKNSILSPGVIVESGAEVIDSIIFHDTKIGHNATLHKVICDKDSLIGNDARIGTFGEEIPSGEFDNLLHSGITILGRKSNVPHATRIGANTVCYPHAHITDSVIAPGSTLR
jgi:glucose-1-phosphate adenylyltransferase